MIIDEKAITGRELKVLANDVMRIIQSNYALPNPDWKDAQLNIIERFGIILNPIYKRAKEAGEL